MSGRQVRDQLVKTLEAEAAPDPLADEVRRVLLSRGHGAVWRHGGVWRGRFVALVVRGRGGGRRETDLAGVTQRRGASSSRVVAEPSVWRRRTGDISFPLTVSLLFNVSCFVIELPFFSRFTAVFQ